MSVTLKDPQVASRYIKQVIDDLKRGVADRADWDYLLGMQTSLYKNVLEAIAAGDLKGKDAADIAAEALKAEKVKGV